MEYKFMVLKLYVYNCSWHIYQYEIYAQNASPTTELKLFSGEGDKPLLTYWDSACTLFSARLRHCNTWSALIHTIIQLMIKSYFSLLCLLLVMHEIVHVFWFVYTCAHIWNFCHINMSQFRFSCLMSCTRDLCVNSKFTSISSVSESILPFSAIKYSQISIS